MAHIFAILTVFVPLIWYAPRVLNRKVITYIWNSYFPRATALSAHTKPTVKQSTPGCPYDYILSVYGKGHFAKLVKYLDLELHARDPALFDLVLHVMDVIHFAAILVDDIADHSVLRKGKTAAHHIFGSSETINRSYLRICEMLSRCQQERPSLVPFILDNLTEIHKGQDISLVWRRDGFDEYADLEAVLDAYRHCASLKTGALFRLVGQLVRGSHELDEKMSDFGWFCQLQNDCKNVFSADVITAKGALAEDLSNGEYTFPILVGLHASEPVRTAIAKAMRQRAGGKKHAKILHEAVMQLQKPEVREVCLAELAAVEKCNPQLASLWGRKESMSVTN